MAELKTRPTGVAVDAFLDKVPDPQRREDARRLRATMERLSGEPATMWGSSIVGVGSYHYKYDSGREGDMALVSFSPRAKELVVYGLGVERQEALMARLGKHRTGKDCLYIKRLSEIDEAVLEQLIREALTQ